MENLLFKQKPVKTSAMYYLRQGMKYEAQTSCYKCLEQRS